MNAEKYTQKTWKPLLSRPPKSMAEENKNQYITPEHLLYALVDQDGGLIPVPAGQDGRGLRRLLAELDTLIGRLPKVGGSGDGSICLAGDRQSGEIRREDRQKLHDEYLSVEHLMLGIFAKGSPPSSSCCRPRRNPQRFTEELAKVKTAP
jgi:ATP-dependent Clp protease ATP-binding subunit ClpB